jgi:hypothetical protein
VDTVGVAVVDVFLEKASKVVLMQDDHVIEQFSAYATDPPLGNSILPWASECGSPRLDSKALDRVSDSF